MSNIQKITLILSLNCYIYYIAAHSVLKFTILKYKYQGFDLDQECNCLIGI